ncbi:MAG: hypothetical protein L3J39_06260 [Verrucomicrobiales bacterium]|nr:hypothetical protein [Verrucomicrobiales bacterium]
MTVPVILAGELPKLNIKREALLSKQVHENPVPKAPNKIYTRTFKIISYACCPPDESHKNSKRRTAQSILEDAGVRFPEGTSAVYINHLGQLIVKHYPSGMKMVEAYMQSIHGRPDKDIRYQIEIYRLPRILAQQIQRSVEAQVDHRPERDAVLELVKKEQAQLVNSVVLDARSGQRAVYEDVTEHLYLSRYEWRDSMQAAVPIFEKQKVGTVFMIDPVLGANEYTMTVDLLLEHHTAEPTNKTSQVWLPNKDVMTAVSLPVFHKEIIRTQITTISGHTRLIGTFRPSGKSEDKKQDLMDIVFLKGTVVFIKEVDRTTNLP